MHAARALRLVRERFASEVRDALEQVPIEIAESAIGHAVLAETLIQIAADIVRRQGNPDLLNHLMRHATRIRHQYHCWERAL